MMEIKRKMYCVLKHYIIATLIQIFYILLKVKLNYTNDYFNMSANFNVSGLTGVSNLTVSGK